MNPGILNQVTQEFLIALQRDAQWIQASALHLFYYLVLIQLTVSALGMVLIGESLLQLTVKLIKSATIFGVFYALIQSGGQWIPDLLNGFIQVGQKTGMQSLNPGAIVDQGVSISGAILQGFFGWGLLNHPFVSIVGAVVCIAVLVIYGLIAAELAIVLVKTYVLVALSSLFFSFGASEATRPMAKHYLQSTVGLGLNLMTLYLLIGVGQQLGSEWAHITAQAAQAHELMPMLVILATVIVYYMIIKNVPAFIAGFSGVGGFQNHGATAVGMAINAGMSGANLLLQANRMMGGSIQSAAQGFKTAGLGWQSFQQGFQQSPHSWSGVAQGIKQVASHLGAASAHTVRDAAMKQNTHLSAGQKFNHYFGGRVYPNKNHS